MPTLRAGACDGRLSLLRNIVNNVMPYLVETEASVKLKALNSFLATARVLADPELQQDIADIQLNLENADQSRRVEETMGQLKSEAPPTDVLEKIRDLAQVIVGEPKLDDTASALLADAPLGDNVFRLAAWVAKNHGGQECVKLTSRVLTVLEKRSPEVEQVANILSAGASILCHGYAQCSTACRHEVCGGRT